MQGNRDNPEDALRSLRDIIECEGNDLRSVLYRNIVLNSLKCKRGELDILDLKIIDRMVAEFRYAASVFKPYRSVRKVSVFGSARVKAGDPYYQLAVDFGRSIVEKGFMVITGASEGIMRAGIEGAGPEKSFGVNILLPSEQLPASIIQDNPRLVTFKYFFTRKVFFVMEADAIALFPGGFGTHDEGFEVLTLLQTGKAPPMPVILMELPGEEYWETWDRFIREQMLKRGLIQPAELSFYRIMHDPQEAAEWIADYYSTYHSARQVRDTLVIRTEKELTNENLAALNRDFSDLVESGNIHRAHPSPDEEDEPELKDKARIAFCYNRKSPGRLNEMILAINSPGAT